MRNFVKFQNLPSFANFNGQNSTEISFEKFSKKFLKKKIWYYSFSFQVYENWKMTLIILFSVINLNRMSDSVKIRIFVNRRQVTNFFKVMTFKGNYCCEINESSRAITSWVFMKISGGPEIKVRDICRKSGAALGWIPRKLNLIISQRMKRVSPRRILI